MDATDLLRSIPLFEGLAEEDLVALSATLVPCQYRAGVESGSSSLRIIACFKYGER